MNTGRAAIRFTLNGRQYGLSRADVEARIAEVTPEVIRKHAVRINDTWFPVIQAFEVASGILRSEYMSNTARRHLASLGFEIAGNVEPRAPSPSPVATGGAPRNPTERRRVSASSTRAESGTPRPTSRPRWSRP